VLLVDDHPLVRRGVREQFERTGRYVVVAEAGTGEEAVRLAQLARPELVLMDLHLPGIGGTEATRQITAAAPDLTVLALSAESEADVLLEVLEAGGIGFVRKSTADQDLLPALETVLNGEVFLYPSGNKLLLGEFRFVTAGPGSSPAGALSEHERQVLALAAEGFHSTEIGKKLFLSPKTVDSYRSRAMRKLGLGSRPDLVRFAVRAGLLCAESTTRSRTGTYPGGEGRCLAAVRAGPARGTSSWMFRSDPPPTSACEHHRVQENPSSGCFPGDGQGVQRTAATVLPQRHLQVETERHPVLPPPVLVER
jgi:two-component system, NarL family, response regulator NreC